MNAAFLTRIFLRNSEPSNIISIYKAAQALETLAISCFYLNADNLSLGILVDKI